MHYIGVIYFNETTCLGKRISHLEDWYYPEAPVLPKVTLIRDHFQNAMGLFS